MFLNLRIGCRSFNWARSILWMAGLCAINTASADGPALSGIIKNSTGQPLADATVFIYTAAPKDGPGLLCPSCYADCRKHSTTGADGKFKIDDLDSNLLFRILVVAPKCQPKFAGKIDPAKTNLQVALKPVFLSDVPLKRLRGHVIDPNGKPVAGAVINLRGVTRDSMTQFGGNDDVDPVAVTDGHGNFLLNSTKPFQAAGVDVEARGLAKAVFQSLASGDDVHQLKLTEGASIKGRLLKNGQPVAKATIGVSGANRASDSYVGESSVSTDTDGRFLLVNLPPQTGYDLYGTMQSLQGKGSLPSRTVYTEGDGSTVDLGDLNLQPGYMLKGQVRLTDGKPVPPKTRVLLGRQNAWDSCQATVDKEGRFQFDGIPADAYLIATRVKGYRFSLRNASLDTLNPSFLIGHIQTNKTNLIIEMEPGPRRESSDEGDVDVSRDPLRGAEAEPGTPDDVKITGTVVDANTGKPIPAFTVTEGAHDRMEGKIRWMETRQTTFSNGTFTLFLRPQPQGVAVSIGADGHWPQAFLHLPAAGTNLAVALKPGNGPSGQVLRPDGQPLTNATVYLPDLENGVQVDGKIMKVREDVFRGTRRTQTDATGHFSFSPRQDDFAVVVVDDAGFAEVKMPALQASPIVRLQPWARVEGKLLIGSRPGTNEEIRLTGSGGFYRDYPRQFGCFSMFLRTTTDSAGHFVFERVPPMDVEIYHSPKVRDSGMGIIPETQVTYLSPAPGAKQEVVLGGRGRPVTGRVVVHGYDGDIQWRADVQSLETVVPEPSNMPSWPALHKERGDALAAAKTDEAKAAAQQQIIDQQDAYNSRMHDFSVTEQGRQYWAAHRRYALNFSKDGSFRVEDVPGGKYRLNLDFREGGGGIMRFNAPKIASIEKEIEVPDSPGGRSDQSFDLGVIELQAHKSLKKGKAAPEFSIKAIDGQPIRLSDYKGKYVLLDFWATWCGPCCGETPNLKETYAAFKNDPRFVMIGLSLDAKADAPRDYAKKNDIGWHQGFLGEWSKTDVPSQFGVESIPSIFLIGPDGKVLARDLRGGEIKSAIQSALKLAD